jgi:hypothetical protein
MPYFIKKISQYPIPQYPNINSQKLPAFKNQPAYLPLQNIFIKTGY